MLLKYKNFIAEINYISRTGCFCGEVVNNNEDGLIIFQAEHQQKLAEAFQIAVEQYLLFMESVGLLASIAVESGTLV